MKHKCAILAALAASASLLTLAAPVLAQTQGAASVAASALGAAPETSQAEQAASLLLRSVKTVVSENPSLADSVGDRAMVQAVELAVADNPEMSRSITEVAKRLKPHLSSRIDLAAADAAALSGNSMAPMEEGAAPDWAFASAEDEVPMQDSGFASDGSAPDWASAPVDADTGSADDIFALGLEDLMNTRVVTASKSKERAFNVPAAISVITNEDLRRSGVTSVAEALRMVPGVHVAQYASGAWSVGARGFGDQFSNKLLVMVDGRSVYTPTFSGVYWENLNMPMEDIDRIEVIRGPGATIWGANAVNGVINIVTKEAKYTQGAYVSAGAGNIERAFAEGRVGGELGDYGHYRLYSRYLDRESYDSRTTGDEARSDWWRLLSGFRADWQNSRNDKFTVHGQLQKGGSQQTMEEYDSEVTEAYIRGKWTRALDDGSILNVNSYLDHRRSITQNLDLQETNADIDFNHTFNLSSRNELIWGGGYRFSADQYEEGPVLSFIPDNDEHHLFSAFLQNKFQARDDLDLILGSKFEHNSYTGFEVQPTAKFSFRPSEQSTIWGSVARAVRTPSRVEDSIELVFQQLPASPPLLPLPQLVTGLGNEDVEAEELIAYELGYRLSPQEGLIFDLAAYYNDYENLTTLTQGTPFVSGSNIIVPLNILNLGEATIYGAELAVNWQVSPSWRLAGHYAYSKLETETPSGSNLFLDYENLWPEHMASFRSYYNITQDVELDTSFYWVSSLDDALGPDVATPQPVESYLKADVRLGWRPWETLELSLAALNLIDDDQRQFIDSRFSNASLIGRSYYGKLTWHF